MPSVSGKFGIAPKIAIPKKKAGEDLQIKTLIPGKGTQIKKNDLAVANYVGYTWNGNTSKEAASSFKLGAPQAFPVGQLVKGLDQGLIGQQVGSRVEIVIPPKDGYGAQGQQQAGISPNDTLVFVMDVMGVYGKSGGLTAKQTSDGGGDLPTVKDAGAGNQPKITLPKNDPPSGVQSKTLIEGTGAKVKQKQLVVAKYTGEVWRSAADDKKKPAKGTANLANGGVFDSSWKAAQGRIVGQPSAFTLTSGGATGQGVIKGWVDGLVGKKIGSRVLLTVPPAQGYGKTGQASAGIRPNDTLIFVVDILGAH
ncbi:MAG TPA: FKBP-type peptidyl-prolyl cis-trans isomerase [Streptosporangiaceae bacterium]